MTNARQGCGDKGDYTVECRDCGELYEAAPEDCDEYGGPACPACNPTPDTMAQRCRGGGAEGERLRLLKIVAAERPAFRMPPICDLKRTQEEPAFSMQQLVYGEVR